MDLTVIISYYKGINNLRLILKALNNQDHNNFEVIISEDDYNPETISFIEENKISYNFAIKHLYQKVDDGFRKNQMLNRSIKKALSDVLSFIDGDCIPHKYFVKEYIKNVKEGIFLVGRRVMLGKKISSQILKTSSLNKLNFISLLLSDSNMVKEGLYSPYIPLVLKIKGLKGCNWGIFKKHLLDINGFDEDYIGPAVGEDTDVEWRLIRNGLKPSSIKNKAIVYHLYHPRSYSQEGVSSNIHIVKRKIKEQNIQCLKGIQNLGNKTE